MSRLDHPFFVKLYFTFQDVDKLYFGLSYAKNGELLKYIRKIGSFDETCTRFYTAEMVCALEYLHDKGIIHRDLKPENILLSEDMHIQITDFGTAKVLSSDTRQARANSFVGTAQYVSPELLTEKSACKRQHFDGALTSITDGALIGTVVGTDCSDLWALGCIVYQLVAGLPPFRAGNEYLIFQKIIKLEYDFPEKFFPRAKDLVEKLLVQDPIKRLGCEELGGFGPLKAHSFFDGITWQDLHLQTPPKLTAYLPAMAEDDEEFYGNVDQSSLRVLSWKTSQKHRYRFELFITHYVICLYQFQYDDLLSQFGNMQVALSVSPQTLLTPEPIQPKRSGSNIEQYIHDIDNNSFELDLQFSEEEKRLLLEKQAGGNQW
ncbi:hypothetical protein AB205_0142120 [Aquarana catesbeiana]|uniref:non-specific serine/threonine protein kinase n=1 Tax=Aquarana catesbeiana TaxID=8400 RepID=A0A2G9SCW6_AQUCT|nr:hypothetical protein AB205_0142120 [Aquarana catesbeiana]